MSKRGPGNVPRVRLDRGRRVDARLRRRLLGLELLLRRRIGLVHLLRCPECLLLLELLLRRLLLKLLLRRLLLELLLGPDGPKAKAEMRQRGRMGSVPRAVRYHRRVACAGACGRRGGRAWD